MSKGMPETVDIEAVKSDQSNDYTGNELLKETMNQMQDQIDDIKEQNATTLASLNEQNELLRDQIAALQPRSHSTTPQDGIGENADMNPFFYWLMKENNGLIWLGQFV